MQGPPEISRTSQPRTAELQFQLRLSQCIWLHYRVPAAPILTARHRTGDIAGSTEVTPFAAPLLDSTRRVPASDGGSVDRGRNPVLDKVIFMLMTVALIGLLILFGLASAVGIVDGRSQRSAWNRIAAGRRHLAEYRSALREHELSLDARQLDLDALERRLQLRERTVAEQERALDDRVLSLDRREHALADREGFAARGPDAA